MIIHTGLRLSQSLTYSLTLDNILFSYMRYAAALFRAVRKLTMTAKREPSGMVLMWIFRASKCVASRSLQVSRSETTK